MVGQLQRVMVCSPRAAGWDQAARWKELGFHHEPDFVAAQTQHEAMCRQLQAAGAELVQLPPAPDLTLDAVYAHDASLATDFGVVLMRPGKANRVAEARHQREVCQGLGIPVFGEIQSPGTTEAGDIVWLDKETLLVGRGYRTNEQGIAHLRALLAPEGVEVVSAPLPYGAGPSACWRG